MHDSTVSLRRSFYLTRSLSLGLACASLTASCSSYYPLGHVLAKEQDLAPEDAPAELPRIDFQFAGALDQPAFGSAIDYELVTRMVGVGDLDGDGRDDLASVVNDYAAGAAVVHLWYGGARPTDPAQIADFVLSDAQLTLSATPHDDEIPLPFFEIVGGGDVDGDGYADLFVRALFCEDTLSPTGVHLVYGGPDRIVGRVALASVASAFVPLEGSKELYRCGAGTAMPPGDLDGDGISDIVITRNGAPGSPEPAAPDDGWYVFYGRKHRFSGEVLLDDADAVLHAPPELSLLALGDVDGDGLGDLFTKNLYGQVDGTFFLAGQNPRLSGSHELGALATFLEGAYPSLPAGPDGPPGDLDADGMNDVLLQDDDLKIHLFYGAAGLFGGGLDFGAADAQIDLRPFEPDPLVVGRLMFPQIITDRDGDGDAELIAAFVSGTGPLYWFTQDVAIVSGSSTRLSGDVHFPRDEIIAQRPQGLNGNAQRAVQTIIPAGDLDGDGVADLMTVSATPIAEASHTELHVHYGVQGEARGLSLIR